MTIDSFLSKNENASDFKIGQIVDARSRLWRIERHLIPQISIHNFPNKSNYHFQMI